MDRLRAGIVQPVDVPGALDVLRHQAGLLQEPQMPGDGRPADRHHRRQSADRLGPLAEQLEDSAALRIAERCERVLGILRDHGPKRSRTVTVTVSLPHPAGPAVPTLLIYGDHDLRARSPSPTTSTKPSPDPPSSCSLAPGTCATSKPRQRSTTPSERSCSNTDRPVGRRVPVGVCAGRAVVGRELSGWHSGGVADDGPSGRLAELTVALSLATDLGTGQPMEHGLRTCWLSLAAAEALGLDAATRSCVYYVALLRFLGCTSDAVGDRGAGGRRRRGVQRGDGADADGPAGRGHALLRAPPGRGPPGRIAAPGGWCGR